MKTVAVFTGTRAEYGLLRNLLLKLNKAPDFNLKIIASGMHLSSEFGLTYKEIEADGLVVAEKIEILLSSDSAIGVCKSIGLGAISISETLSRITPDFMIVLGDRFEALSAAQVATVMKIPLIHIHGGESTVGAMDEAIRHAITKMSYLHFTTTEAYRKRVIQLGESPDRVYTVGSPGVENCMSTPLLKRDELEKQIGFKFLSKNFLVTFHPATLDTLSAEKQIEELLNALDVFPDVGVIFTLANADPSGRNINSMVESYVQKKSNAVAHHSLGVKRYLSCMANVDVVIGNSSSGIIEAPSFKIPTINIGSRQKGRVQASSVINVESKKELIRGAVERALSAEFKATCKHVVNPYELNGTSDRMLSLIREFQDKLSVQKEFYDL